MAERLRVQLREGAAQAGVTARVAAACRLSDDLVVAQASHLNDRLMQVLSLENAPIVVGRNGSWSVDGVAGLMRLNASVEIEVIPKFLQSDESWREDFFMLAVLVRTGRLLTADDVSARAKERGDLATLVARALLSMHQANQRRPIRGYRSEIAREFSLDGEVDVESLLLPEADGFRVGRVALTRENEYNSVLREALRTLLPEVGDGETRQLVERQLHVIGRQSPPPRSQPARLPARYRPWQPAYDLSRLVVEGMGLDLDNGGALGPGFVLSTWQAWQALCEELVRRTFPGRRVMPQREAKLGDRLHRDLVVKPDVSVLESATVKLLLDAKYKSRIGKTLSVSNADAYESLAFMRGTGCDRLVLLYPSLHPLADAETGSTELFESISVGAQRIDALAVQVRGMAQRHGFTRLVAGLRDGVDAVAPGIVELGV